MNDVYAENHQNDPDNKPTADAAKLLPCPTFWVVERFENEQSAGYWSGGNSRAFLTDIEKAVHFCRREDAMWTIIGWHWGDVRITEHVYLENTRPQPAPPAGEPDFGEDVARSAYEIACKALGNDYAYVADCQAAIEKLVHDSLGLAARPKVEDAEVTKIASDLRESGKVLDNGVTKILDAGFFIKAADLLERLAGASKHYLACLQLETDKRIDTESKLAEREAELAKADAIVHGIYGKAVGNGFTYPGDITDACERHAARQQQKASAEPTERDEE